MTWAHVLSYVLLFIAHIAHICHVMHTLYSMIVISNSRVVSTGQDSCFDSVCAYLYSYAIASHYIISDLAVIFAKC